MSNTNTDLQASHQILNIMESSKARVDAILDSMPGFFIVMEMNGTIMKGNRKLAVELNVSHERLLGQNLKIMFKPDVWKIMTSSIQKVLAGGPNVAPVEFELPTIGPDGEPKPFLWMLSPFVVNAQAKGNMVSVVGRDISALRKTERELTEFFTTIPVGIMMVNAKGKIEPRYSAHLEWLLGASELAGQDFIEAVFRSGWSKLNKDQTRAIEGLLATFGDRPLMFDLLREQLPRQIGYTIRNEFGTIDRYLGMSYQPILSDEKVHRLLVLIEDQTERVRSRLEEEKERARLEESAIRINQIKRCAPDLLEICMVELDPVVQDLAKACAAQDAKLMLNRLHTSKGNSRILGFDGMRVLTHELERNIKDAQNANAPQDWAAITEEVEKIQTEWAELSGLYEALILRKKKDQGTRPAGDAGATFISQAELKSLFDGLNSVLSQPESPTKRVETERFSAALQAGSFIRLDSVKDALAGKVNATAAQLGKKVKLDFSLPEIWVDPTVRDALSECFLHLCNNALSHGIESPEKRESMGKPSEGQIKIELRDGPFFVDGTVSDDGAGVLVEKVKASALKKGDVTLEQFAKMSAEDIMQLIFRRDLSTAEKLTDISGQGIGLDVVKGNFEKFGGFIRVENRPEGGARFVFRIGKIAMPDIARAATPLLKTMGNLVEDLRQMAGELGTDLTLGNVDHAPGIWVGDERRVMSAISTIVATWLGSGKSSCKTDIQKTGSEVVINIERTNGAGDLASLPLAIRLASPAAWMVLRQHKGELEYDGSRMICRFGLALGQGQVPTVNFMTPAAKAGGSDAFVDSLKKRMGPIVSRLGANLVWSTGAGPSDGDCDMWVSKELVTLYANADEETLQSTFLRILDSKMGLQT